MGMVRGTRTTHGIKYRIRKPTTIIVVAPDSPHAATPVKDLLKFLQSETPLAAPPKLSALLLHSGGYKRV